MVRGGGCLERWAERLHNKVTVRIKKFQKVQRRKVAGCVIEEHVFGARIRGIDSIGGFACMPPIDRRIVLYTWVSAIPCGFGHPTQEVARAELVSWFAVGHIAGPPREILFG